jgi:hypothetical protein
MNRFAVLTAVLFLFFLQSCGLMSADPVPYPLELTTNDSSSGLYPVFQTSTVSDDYSAYSIVGVEIYYKMYDTYATMAEQNTTISTYIENAASTSSSSTSYDNYTEVSSLGFKRLVTSLDSNPPLFILTSSGVYPWTSGTCYKLDLTNTAASGTAYLRRFYSSGVYGSNVEVFRNVSKTSTTNDTSDCKSFLEIASSDSDYSGSTGNNKTIYLDIVAFTYAVYNFTDTKYSIALQMGYIPYSVTVE